MAPKMSSTMLNSRYAVGRDETVVGLVMTVFAVIGPGGARESAAKVEARVQMGLD